MPLEGVSSSGSFVPPGQKAEAAALGAFEKRVENTSAFKKLQSNEKSKDDVLEGESEGDFSGGRYTEKDDESAQSGGNKSKHSEMKTIKYSMRFNRYTELVELVDFDTGKVLETISPNDLMSLISELKYTSGIFIDNEI